MKQVLRTTLFKLFSFIKGAFGGAFISLAPSVLIHHKDLNSYFSHLNWSLLTFFTVPLLTLAIGFALQPKLANKNAVFSTAYLFFFTACAVLCQRIGLTLFVPRPILPEAVITCDTCPALLAMSGTILLILAAAHFVKGALKENSNASSSDHKVNQSLYLSWLLFIAATPLIFGVWLPLLALPGAWVITRWLD